MWVASDHLGFRGDDAVASAWLRRGRELLGDHEPCSELGYITLLHADIALLAKSDPTTAERLAREALDLAGRSTMPVSRSSRLRCSGVRSSPQERSRRGCCGWRSAGRGRSARSSLRRLRPAGRCVTRSRLVRRSATSGVPSSGVALFTRGRRCGRRGTSSASAAPPMAKCSRPAVIGRPPSRSFSAPWTISVPPARLSPRRLWFGSAGCECDKVIWSRRGHSSRRLCRCRRPSSRSAKWIWWAAMRRRRRTRPTGSCGGWECEHARSFSCSGTLGTRARRRG